MLGERQARASEGVGGENVHEALERYEADVGRVGVEGDGGAGAGVVSVGEWGGDGGRTISLACGSRCRAC